MNDRDFGIAVMVAVLAARGYSCRSISDRTGQSMATV